MSEQGGQANSLGSGGLWESASAYCSAPGGSEYKGVVAPFADRRELSLRNLHFDVISLSERREKPPGGSLSRPPTVDSQGHS